MKVLRQVWQTAKSQPLYTAIYVFGTALALTTLAIYAITTNNKIGPTYPELNRARTAYITSLGVKRQSSNMISQFSYDAVNEWLPELKDMTLASVRMDLWDKPQSQVEGKLDIPVTFFPTDTAFWMIYDFNFLAGHPYNGTDFTDGQKVAVITDGYAEQAFGKMPVEEYLGREISVNYMKYRVKGVVEAGSPLNSWSYAEVYVPYTAVPDYRSWEMDPLMGEFMITVLTDDADALRSNLRQIAQRYNTSHADEERAVNFFDQPLTHTEFALGKSSQATEFSAADVILKAAGALLVLLLVPALNLSGMVSGRMEARNADTAVRRSFGATRSTIMAEIMAENFIFTIVGAVIGFFFAWLLLSTGVYGVEVEWQGLTAIGNASFFSPWILLACFVGCLVLNIVSAAVPAWRAARRPIVESLKQK